ncbi:hypothetical protein KL86DPRO_40066 [uncultured delta proteobacterium]|uniref:Uncharacterized protein n=1 Tax=uncultured delta proteobacterium TaxID=34034 RepID=A0A212K988_9DELT|nr:hypothetical protein KL86DPRO_40066 [uncultured delta proteobacterium]
MNRSPQVVILRIKFVSYKVHIYQRRKRL